MSAGWVAGSVRGRLLTRRRLGRAGARALAESGAAAVTALAESPYRREVRAGMPPERAQRAVGAVCLWHLRVLAGWLPARGSAAVRVFAGRFELANIADRFEAVAGHDVPEPFELGALAEAWPRVAAAATAAAVREALVGSAWGDPGATAWVDAEPALEARWAGWLAAAVPGQPAWSAGAATLVVARRLVSGRPLPAAAVPDVRRRLGRDWESAADLAELAARVPRPAAWVLDGVERADDLWPAEGRWWRRVDRDAREILRRPRPGPEVAAAAAARLVADAWFTGAALEAAGWGPRGREAFDALA